MIQEITMKNLFITVLDMAGLDTLRPLTGGVPIAEGAAPEGSVFVLRDHQGNTVPLQTSVLARWQDGSARWILLDFQANPPANGKLSYVLSWGRDAEPKNSDVVVCRSGEENLALESGNIKVSLADGTLLSISERIDVILSLTDTEGQVCDAVVESSEIETTGKLRSTLLLLGSFQTQARERVFQFRLRASIYAGRSMIRLEPLILVDADKGVIQRIREMKLTLKPRNHTQAIRLGGDPGWEGSATSEVRLFQYDDQHYALQNAEGSGSKAPGWAELNDGQGDIAVALRDFWQQWPKSL